MQYLRSLLFTTYMMASACVVGLAMALCFWLPYSKQLAMGRAWARTLFWALERLCRLDYVVDGRENLPATNHIAMWNHSSTWETFAPFLLLPAHVWVLKRELLSIPFVGWGLRRLKPIAIDRGAGHRAVSQVIEQGRQRLAAGLWVVIFPEGTRVKAGEVRKYGVSGALLATASGKAVVPISHNAGHFWPRRGFLKRPGTVRVVIGKPIDSAGKDPRQLNEEVRAAINAGLARIAQQAAAAGFAAGSRQA